MRNKPTEIWTDLGDEIEVRQTGFDVVLRNGSDEQTFLSPQVLTNLLKWLEIEPTTQEAILVLSSELRKLVKKTEVQFNDILDDALVKYKSNSMLKNSR